MYVLAKYKLHVLKAFEVTVIALQSSSNRKIDLYGKYCIRKSKLNMFAKMNVTYKWSDLQTQNLHRRVFHELKNGLLGNLFLVLFCMTTNKVKIHE